MSGVFESNAFPHGLTAGTAAGTNFEEAAVDRATVAVSGEEVDAMVELVADMMMELL